MELATLLGRCAMHVLHERLYRLLVEVAVHSCARHEWGMLCSHAFPLLHEGEKGTAAHGMNGVLLRKA
eukprot:17540-Pelagomonas_calceolata.AAC.1